MEVASLRVNEQAVVELTAGPHVVVGRMDWASSRDLTVQVPEGEQVEVEVSLPFASVFLSFVRPNRAVLTRLVE
ncbi:MAG: hypothetical protein ACR2MN_13460 [Acidimicrobiales bacterium]